MANLRIAELLDRQGHANDALPRWQGLASMLQDSTQGSPQLEAILQQVRERVSSYTAIMAQELEDFLEVYRVTHAPADLRRVERCVDVMLGRSRTYLNDCHGVYFPFLPADEFFARKHIPWLEALEDKTAAIRAECEALLAAPDSGFEPYVALEPGSPENLWTPLAGSNRWSARHLWRHGERVDDMCERCPLTAAALNAVPQAQGAERMPTAFFSILQPHTRIPAHTGVSNVRAIVHLPLIVPPGCGFRVGGETRHWRVGESLVFDDTIEHEAWNDSEAIRAVLIFDVWNPHLTSYEQSVLQGVFLRLYNMGIMNSNGVD